MLFRSISGDRKGTAHGIRLHASGPGSGVIPKARRLARIQRDITWRYSLKRPVRYLEVDLKSPVSLQNAWIAHSLCSTVLWWPHAGIAASQSIEGPHAGRGPWTRAARGTPAANAISIMISSQRPILGALFESPARAVSDETWRPRLRLSPQRQA